MRWACWAVALALLGQGGTASSDVVRGPEVGLRLTLPDGFEELPQGRKLP